MSKLKSLYVYLTACLLLLAPGWAMAQEGRDSLRSFRGSYAYQFSGEFGSKCLSNTAIETGVWNADGRGRFTGVGTAVVNGNVVVPNVTYEGFYTVENNVATVRVVRVSTLSGSVNLTLLLSLANETDSILIQAQPEPGTPFAFLNVHGEGRK